MWCIVFSPCPIAQSSNSPSSGLGSVATASSAWTYQSDGWLRCCQGLCSFSENRLRQSEIDRLSQRYDARLSFLWNVPRSRDDFHGNWSYSTLHSYSRVPPFSAGLDQNNATLQQRSRYRLLWYNRNGFWEWVLHITRCYSYVELLCCVWLTRVIPWLCACTSTRSEPPPIVHVTAEQENNISDVTVYLDRNLITQPSRIMVEFCPLNGSRICVSSEHQIVESDEYIHPYIHVSFPEYIFILSHCINWMNYRLWNVFHCDLCCCGYFQKIRQEQVNPNVSYELIVTAIYGDGDPEQYNTTHTMKIIRGSNSSGKI